MTARQTIKFVRFIVEWQIILALMVTAASWTTAALM
jgi:hypothetical protein